MDMDKIKVINHIGSCCFYIAVIFFITGFIASFVPGGERDYFIILSVLFIVSIFTVNKKAIKVISLILFILTVLTAYDGHKKGIEYQKFVEESKSSKIP